MNKYVIYTVLVGNYDKLTQPLVVDKSFDYVLFTDKVESQTIGVWQVRPIPIPQKISADDNKRLSRYPKTHPETLFPGYKASLYIDANIQIVDQWVYDRVVDLVEQKVEYAGVNLLLTGQDCVYRHAYDMSVMRAENDVNAIVEMHALYKEGFPEHYSLNENNIIYRRHNERMQRVNELWWKWIVKYSYRDQFSYMYCLWKYDIPKSYFLLQGEDSRNSIHFRYISHNEDPEVAQQKWVKQGLLEKLRNKCRKLSRFHYRLHCNLWMFAIKTPCPKQSLIIGGILSTIINSPLIITTYIYKKFKKNESNT